MNIQIIIASYYLSPKKILAKIKPLLEEKIFEDIIIVVNNINYESSVNGVNTIIGTNSLLDFSAYHEGLKKIEIVKPTFSGVTLFINDSFFIKFPYKYVLKKIINDLKENAIDGPLGFSISGTYDFYLTSNPWANTNKHMCGAIFALNQNALNSFKSLLIELDFIKSKLLKPFDLSVFVDKSFFNYIDLLLFSKNKVWKPLHDLEVSQEMLIKKSLAFYAEHKLTADLNNAGGGIIYANRGFNNLIYRVILKIKRFLI